MIYEILQERGAIGEENAMPTETLMELTGLRPRVIRQRVNAERRTMRFIASTRKKKGGYYIPATGEEMAEFLRKQEIACRRMFGWVNPLKKAVEAKKDSAGLFDERLDNGQK